MRKMTIDELRHEELRVLIFADKFCKENKLKYSMAHGTLLGAVRHNGFIPWDDDIDIIMPRQDYELFKEEFIKMGGKSNIDLFHYDLKEDYPYPFMKLASTRSYIDEKNLREKYKKCHYGAWVDIFPMDYIRDTTIFQEKVKLFKKINFLIFKRIPTHAISKRFQSQIEYLKKKVYPSLPKLLEKMDKEQCYDVTEYMACNMWDYIGKEIVPASIWDNLKKYNFEEHEFLGFADDIYLKALYGDYMKLPPREERKPHYMDAYWI